MRKKKKGEDLLVYFHFPAKTGLLVKDNDIFFKVNFSNEII
jgi:hypothetical protein